MPSPSPSSSSVARSTFRVVPCLACRDFCLLMLRLLATTSGKRREKAVCFALLIFGQALIEDAASRVYAIVVAEQPRQACFAASPSISLFPEYLTVFYTYLLVSLINVLQIWRNKFLLTSLIFDFLPIWLQSICESYVLN